MEELLDAKTIAIITSVLFAASEIIGILNVKSTGNIHLALRVIKRLFNIK